MFSYRNAVSRDARVVLIPAILTALAGCSDRDPMAAPNAMAMPRFSQSSATPVVNSLADPGIGGCDDTECTLREAIGFANANGIITFDPALTSGGAAQVTLDPASGQLLISKNLTITGPGASLMTVRRESTSPGFRIIEVTASRDIFVTIAGLTISGGSDATGGGIANQSLGALTLRRMVITGNTASGSSSSGGGIYTGGRLTIDSSTISNNQASGPGAAGGGIYIGGGTMVITNSTMSGNSAEAKGGGIFQYVGGVELTNVTLTGNSASGGGAMSKEDASHTASLTNVTVAGNSANQGGGILSLSFRPALTLTNSIIADNSGGNCGPSNPSIADGGGNLVFPSTSPCQGITPVSTDDPLLGPLQFNTPGITATMALGAGSAALDVAVAANCPTTDQRGVSRPQGAGCDIGAYEAEAVTDATRPDVVPHIAGTLGNNGWYTSDVTVTWSVIDAESPVTSTFGCDPVTVSANTLGVTLACTATSAGGTNTQAVRIKRDATAPTLAPTISPNPIFLNGTANAMPNASDAESGIASSSCATLNTATLGTKTVDCTATDRAGNVATKSVSYSVTYQFVGFSEPIDGNGVLNVAKAGRTISLKWRVLNAAGAPITNLSSATVTVANLACPSGATADDVEEYAKGGPGFQNLGNGYYQFNWATPKTYAGSCKTMQLDLGEGITRNALFQFTK
jgi:CSLREA domain-containing protein